MDISPEIKEQVLNLYRNMKHLREKNGLTVKQMAEIMEISEKKLMQAESCIRSLHVKNLIAAIIFRQLKAGHMPG